MFAGIDNYFVLEKIFGQVDIFLGAELNMLNIFWTDSRVNLEIRTAQNHVLNEPKRWKVGEKNSDGNYYIYITLQGVCSFESNIRTSTDRLLKIVSGGIREDDHKNKIELFFEEGQFFKCIYTMGRIQNTSNIPREEPIRCSVLRP